MKRSWLLALILVLCAAAFLGCASPQDKAQKLFNAGQYEEVVAKFGNDPQLAGLVAQAKEKLAEKLVSEGKFQTVLEMYPETAAAKEAKAKLAEGLFAEKKYQEILDKYADTPSAQLARQELDRQRQSAGNTPAGNAPAVDKDKNAKADAELDRILKIKVPALRQKALKEFIANPAFAGTPAIAKAQAAVK